MKKVNHKNHGSSKLLRAQYGLSIVEVMVGITISLLLLAGIVQIVFSNKSTYRVQDAIARVQENGRFSLLFLSKDVRIAGYMGCTSPSSGLNVTNNVDPSLFDYTDDVDGAVGGFDGDAAVEGFSIAASLPTQLTDLGLSLGSSFGDVKDNTDAVFIRTAEPCGSGSGNVLVHNNNAANLSIKDNSVCQIQQNDIVMVSDCENADIFGVTNTPQTGNPPPSGHNLAHGSNLNINNKLSGSYGPTARIYRMRSFAYFIGTGESGEPALFRRELVTGELQSFEMVEGIEDMTILYGEDRNNDGAADIYVDRANVNDMDDVVSLRVTVVSRTLEDNIATSIGAEGDKRVRRDFTSTISIRNRAG